MTNVVYTNGFIDPWLYDGMTYVSGENATVINVNCKEILFCKNLRFFINFLFFIQN